MCYTKTPPRSVHKFKFHKGDYTGMKEEAERMTWQNKNVDNIDDKCYCFLNNIKHLMNNYIPKSRPNQNSLEIKEKKTNFRSWGETCNPMDYQKYAKAKNQAKWECQKAEKDFHKKWLMKQSRTPKLSITIPSSN